MIDYPNTLDKIFDKLISNDARPIIVGGFVRDYLLNTKSYDIDIEIYNIASFQTLENILNECEHPTTIILPISTVLIDDAYPLRYRVTKRDKLDKTSDILCDQIRALDNQRILEGFLTKLTYQEILEVDKQVKIVLGIEI